ncbi:hypothetical protein ZYGR_0I05660 [Zygosaccharomyces rouxii]|uniref:ZYRO0C13442p n=2 Tax=Zygosaccharomyces rouxii TaxID=4956 RepID=C5DU31_ZYGRC|nr:uncharacterized protein ZYRO0C13442g [Zygosaccharomyces rouxii]KAH9201532.1 hypothetical protein LQ764DRAFT_233305 [Zygosaccharomyces rouxii]GAV48269.1 hypothetical protein ZYGR_0I05660 [Zygosaccharomyces rouxii]CAR27292.1 ZYRO0C13442p [Zygosaccharomyces rouxii]
MNRYQSLSSQSNSYGEYTSNFSDLIQGIFQFTFDLSLALIKRLFGSQGNYNSSAIADEFRPVDLQPSLSANGLRSLRFDGNQKSFENHGYHPWLVVAVGLLAVAMLSYDSSKSERKPAPVHEQEESFEEPTEELIGESGLTDDDTSGKYVFRRKLPISLDMPKTFRTQRKEIGLPYQDVTVSRSTPISLLLWESK